MESIKSRARRAGLLYLLACCTAPFSLLYVPRSLLVPGDAAATAGRVRHSPGLLRMGIASELLISILLIFAVLAFYRLFKGVSEKHALAMATLLLVSIPVSLFNVLNHIAALVLVSGADFLSPFDMGQLDALTYLFLRLHSQGVFVTQIFWGLWLFPFGILVIRSGFIPRFLGVLLLVAGSGYLLASFASLFLPALAPTVSQATMLLQAGEVPLVVWLLVWGAKTQPSHAPTSESPGG